MQNSLPNLFGSPGSQDMLFGLIAQQMAQLPEEKRLALGKVEVVIIKKPRGLNLSIGESGDPEIAQDISRYLETWTVTLARFFQATGLKVKLYE